MSTAHTQTEENYLKAIYHLSAKTDKPVNTNTIAGAMETSAASVTDMLKRLSEKSLINYEKYRGVRITRKGEKVAVNIVRRHRLWEVFLTQTLHFRWDEVHNMAEELEHVSSDELVARLEKFLGHPRFDPHGDPIPDESGKLPVQTSDLLSEGQVNHLYEVMAVSDHSPVFLRFLEKHGLKPGITFRITEIQEVDQSMIIQLNNQQTVYLSLPVTQQILVKHHENF